jgi:predicted sulfurtransferase
MTNSIEHEQRRLIILEGINGGIENSEIAEKLGVPLWVVRRDLKKMRYNRDPELKKAYKKAQERVQVKKQIIAISLGERFHRMTGMTFKEKAFNNMMSFYKPELTKILNAENECDAIRDLPNSVRKTLKRNGIIAQGWKVPEITEHARAHLTGVPSVNS